MKKLISTTRRPDITFHASGLINITTRVARILHLTEDACLNIAVEKGEYLLFAEHYSGRIGTHTARCYPVNAGGRYCRAHSIALCNAMLQACGASEKAPLMCGEPLTLDGNTYLPIITKKIL